MLPVDCRHLPRPQRKPAPRFLSCKGTGGGRVSAQEAHVCTVPVSVRLGRIDRPCPCAAADDPYAFNTAGVHSSK